jgi:hypothetical protein
LKQQLPQVEENAPMHAPLVCTILTTLAIKVEMTLHAKSALMVKHGGLATLKMCAFVVELLLQQ